VRALPASPAARPSAAAAVRQRPCADCGTGPGLPCTLAGDHMQRWADAFAAGVVSQEAMAAVLDAVDAITRSVVVPAGVTA
jgi:hypothetical protein